MRRCAAATEAYDAHQRCMHTYSLAYHTVPISCECDPDQSKCVYMRRVAPARPQSCLPTVPATHARSLSRLAQGFRDNGQAPLDTVSHSGTLHGILHSPRHNQQVNWTYMNVHLAISDETMQCTSMPESKLLNPTSAWREYRR